MVLFPTGGGGCSFPTGSDGCSFPTGGGGSCLFPTGGGGCSFQPAAAASTVVPVGSSVLHSPTGDGSSGAPSLHYNSGGAPSTDASPRPAPLQGLPSSPGPSHRRAYLDQHDCESPRSVNRGQAEELWWWRLSKVTL